MILPPQSNLDNIDFLAGTTLLVDKPLEWTSFDVVNKIRYGLKRHLNVKKIKVGHAGTLDPLATGLLIICTGKSTKTIDGIQGKNKTYAGTMQLGATTPSYDAETEIDQKFETDHIDIELLRKAAKEWTGDIDQKPPIFSALKKNGKALYKYARKGQDVEIKTRPVHVGSFDILSYENGVAEFFVECSKGTYVRSLVYDVGISVKSGAYLSGLRRNSIGEYKIEDAWDLDDFINGLSDHLPKG